MIDVQYKDYNGGEQVSPVVFGPVAEDAIAGEAQRGLIIKDDFTGGIGSAATSLDGWVVTEITGTAGSGELNDAGVAGGVVSLKAELEAGAGIQLQKSESIAIASGKKLAAECRVALSDADDISFLFGLTTTAGDIVGTNPNDIVAFLVDAGDASIKYKVAKDGTGSAVDSGSDASDGTYVKLGFNYDGDSTIEFFVDGTSVGTVTANIPDDEVLALSLGAEAGSTAAVQALVDYVKVVAEM